MRKYFLTTLCLLLLWSLTAVADTKIVDVDFKGLISVTEPTARSQIESIEGTIYSERSVKRDIKKLYMSGLFSDVTVDKENLSGGIKLTFTVSEKRTVGKLKIIGNKKIKEDEITDALRIQEYDLLDPAKIAQTKASILKLYEDKGYYLVDIQSSIEPFDEEKNQVELILKIRENRPVKIKRIRFVGNKKFADSKLRGKIRTKEKGFFSFLSSSGKLEDEKLNTDLQMLRYFYLDNGYLRVKVGDPDITLTRDKQAIYISIPIYEGRQYKVNSVSIAGDILTTEDEIKQQIKQKPNEIYKKSLEIEDMNTLEQIYGDQAYAFANIIPHIEADDHTLKADVVYFIQKGEKITIDKIIIKGNAVTRDKVIRREMRILENSYYSQTAINLSKTRLNQLGYFEEINISTPRSTADNTINVVVEVKEKNTGTFSIGAGFSTLESFIFTATVQKENFFGRGWSGGVSLNISKLRQDIILSLSDQYFLDSKWYFGLSFQRYLSQLNIDFDKNLFGGTITFGRELFDFFHLRFGYRAEDVEVKNFSSQVPQFFQDNASGFVSAAFTSLSYDRRDNRMMTKKGFYTKLNGEYSSNMLGATTEYLQVDFDNRVFVNFLKSFVLKGRGLLSYINSIDEKPVPLYNRYFLGGINTLRGYDINSIGPQISVPSSVTGGDSSFVYGGTRLVLFNVELEVPLYAPAGFLAVAFFDGGNAYAEDEQIDLTRLRFDYGAGLRWMSPFGPLRFEWGFPINRKSGETGVVFNFSIGQSF